MAELTSYPLEDGFETTLTQALTTVGTTMYVNDDGDFTFPASVTCYAVINPGKSNVEVVELSAKSSNAFTILTRNIDQGASVTTTAQSHAVGSKVIISDNYQFWKDIVDSLNLKVNLEGDTMTGRLQFSGTNATVKPPAFATTGARDAAITVPTDGDLCTVAGDLQHYNATTVQWETSDTGTPTPNASTTVAGKVEIATTAEFAAGTDTGGTGALLAASPSDILTLAVPPGIISPYGGATAPTGWLLCDGTTGKNSVSDTSLAALYAIIGTTFGGSGASDFDLPDMRGNFPLGKDNMGGASRNRVTDTAADTIGAEGGAQTHTLITAEMPAHTHTTPFGNTDTGGSLYALRQYNNDTLTYNTPGSSTGGGGAHQNMSPYMTLNYIIKK